MDTSKPVFSIDDITDETLARPAVVNRNPQPDETGVPENSTLVFELVDTTIAEGIDASTLNVTVNGANAVVAGVLQSGWDGTRSAVIPVEAWWYRVILDPVSIPSLTDVSVVIDVDTTDAVSGHWEYDYQIEDKSSPQVISAKAIDRKKILVTFGQEIAETDATAVTVTFPWGAESLVKAGSNWVIDPFTLPISKSLSEPFDVSSGEDLIVNVDGVEHTLSMGTSFTTAAAGAAHLSSLLLGKGADAIYKSGVIYMRSLTQTGSLQVVGGVANHSMKFDNAAHTKGLPYQTAEGEYALEIVAQYSTGANSLRTETFTLTNDDLVFLLVGSEEDLTDSSLLVPGNYVLTTDLALVLANITPGFCSDVTKTIVRSSTEIELWLEYDMTPGASYILTVSNVQDPYGNVIDPDNNTASFVGYQPIVDSNRDFEIYPEFPELNRNEDINQDFDLKKYISIFEEVLKSVLYDVDEFRERQRISIAPEEIIDAILEEKGNPFLWFDLTLYEKRKLAGYLVLLMRKKGTDVGIIDAVQLFFKFTVRPTLVTFWGDGWELGVSELGVDTDLEPDAQRLKYSFAIQINRSLTATELLLLERTVNVMMFAKEHFLGVYVPTSTSLAFEFWELGESLLGDTTYLGV